MASTIETADLVKVERWLGRIDSGSDLHARVSDRFEDLEIAELVALEELMADRGTMIRHSAEHATDGVRSNHAKNLERIDGQIAKLAAYIRNSDDITLSTEGEAMVEAAESGGDDGGNIQTVVDNRRRG